MTPLKIFLFGMPRLERGRKTVDVSRRKVAALLAYLAVTDQPQSRDALAALLWPDYDQSSARTNLRRDLSRLKRAVGAEYVAADRNQIALVRSNDLSVDVATFEAAVERVRQHHPAARQLCEVCATTLTDAVALYQDDFLAGFALPDSAAFDEWQFFQTEGLRRKLAEILQRLIDWHVDRAEYARAVDYGRRWVALDGLHEPAQRRLIQLYAWSGQRAAAMRQYQETARLLEEELGEAPEEETVLLYESIRNRELAAPRTRTGPKEQSAEARYEVLDLLAVGGHAEVYYGRDRISGVDVVIKRLKPELLARGTTYLQRFIREARALSHLQHPNIVRMLATFEERGQHSIVMEYVPGGNLRQLLDRESPLPLEKVVNIALELADALARAHHLNIIHRDLKPDNILLAADGTPRLTDFGLARLRRDEVRVTRTGAVVGSPAYMSPEALRGDELDSRSDIWSFGVLLYEMLAGRRPFGGQQLTPVLVSILQDTAPPVTEFRPDTPPGLVFLLQRMLQKDPERRPASMRQVAAEIEAIVQGRAADDRPQTAYGGSAFTESADLQSPISNLATFVGREQTLDQLQALLQRATVGTGTVAFVLGEAGQGKTSLLQTFVQKSLEHFPHLLVAGGNCNAYTGSGDPYLPFREILETLTADRRPQTTVYSPGVLEILLDTGPDLVDTFIPARNIVDRLPEEEQRLRRQVEPVAGRHAPAALQQQDLFEQFARVMKALSRQWPLLLLLDDLQWVDQGSANLLLHLGRSIESHAIMILGAYRPAEVSLGRDGGRHPLETALFELQRLFGDVSFDLSQEEGRPFIDALLDSEPNRLDDAFRETLYRQTGGHPLFTLELLRDMQERGDLIADKDGNWVAQLNLDWHTLPARVEGAIGERISRLPPELRELLDVASVEGEEFTAETVARALGSDERLTMRQISGELDRKHLLVRALDVRHMGDVRLSRYRFRHILIQRYLYNSMDAVEKVYQHEAVARALEGLYGDETAAIAPQLARHLDLAQLPAAAAVYFQQAGDQARRAIALEEAARYFEAALARWPTGNAAGRAVLLRKLGECQWIMGKLQDALATYDECFNLFEKVGDMHGAGAVQRAMGRLHWETGERERSLEHYHHSLEILEKISESVELAWTISSLSQMYMLASQYDESIEWGERALALAERLGADDVKTHALNNVGVAYMETGRLEHGKELVRESLQLALELGLPHDACRAYLNLGEVPAGAYEERRAVLQELAEYATSIRAPLYAGSAHVELGNIEWELGEWRAAQSRRAEIQAWMERAPSMGYLRGVNSVFLGRMYNDLGQFDRALEALEPVLPVVRTQNEVQIIGPYMGQLARALAAQNRVQEAAAVLREMLEAIEAQPYVHRDSTPALLFACTWFAESRPTSDAPEMAARFRDLLEKGDEYGTKPDVAAAWSEATGVVLAACGAAADALPHFQRAVSQWRELGRPHDEARAAIALGRALKEIGGDAGMEAAHRRAASLLLELASQLDHEEDRYRFLNSFPVAKHIETLVVSPQDPEPVVQGHLSGSTAFVGRQKEITEIRQILAGTSEQRLLTLVGPGGVGKTRLALAVASELLKDFSDGVFFVSLAPLTTVDELPAAVAGQLGFRLYDGDDPVGQLREHLRTRKTLLVLDNFEHLMKGATLVADLIAGAPRLSILVTSRERLNLIDEAVYSLHGLEYPSGDPASPLTPDAAECDAVKLLLQRTQQIAPEYKPDDDDLVAAVRITQLVQGMPLPLVLAASWFSLLSFQEIADEISASLDFLESEVRDLEPRQRSVRAVFESSWKLLDREEQHILARLSVFRGSFERKAAEAVTGTSLRTLQTLLHKSWLLRTDQGRFEIHELLRQYTAEKLAANAADEDETFGRHAAYYADFLENQLISLRGPQAQSAYAAIKADFDNVRLAWQWLVQQGAIEPIVIQMLPSLFRYCETRAESFTLLQLLDTALKGLQGPALTGSEALRAALLTAKSAFFRNGYPARFETFGMLLPAREDAIREAWALASGVGGLRSHFWEALLGYLYGRLVDQQEGIRYLRQSLSQLRRDAHPWERAFTLQLLALLSIFDPTTLDTSRFEEVQETLSEALAIFKDVGDTREYALCLRSLGQLQRLQHAFPEAIEHWTEAQSQLEAVGEWSIAADINWQIGDAYLQMGQVEVAFPCYRRMSEAYLSMGHERVAALVLSKESYEAARYGKLALARKRREEALEMARERGDLHSEAWCRWEMGELLRLEGEAEQARTWFEQARVLFEQFGDTTGFTFYHRGLGDLALAAGRLEEAHDEFNKSLQRAQVANHKWAMAYVLAGLGMVSTGMQQLQDARRHLERALREAQESDDSGVTLRVLSAIAHYFQATGDDEQALELAAFVAHHPTSWNESRSRAVALLDASAAPATRTTELKSKAKGLELWTTARRILSALKTVEQPPTKRATHNLPVDSTPFVGRHREITEVQQLLSGGEARLVTLTGPGGIGKTRLALAAADALREAFAAICYVELAALADAEQIVPEIGASLNLPMSGGDPKQLLLDYLRRHKSLLVMDNFEHLLAGAPLLTELLAAAPDLKILATSRERLKLRAEAVYTVQGLDYPPGSPGAAFGPEAAESSAVKLLLQQGRLLVPGFRPEANDLAAMVRIARMVQGMPLALLLAAGWLEVMSFGEIADEIAADLDFLSSEMRDLPERQHSVRATFNTSWRRLDPDSQTAFMKLAVFHDGFTRQAAQAVAGASAHTLRTLVSKSFVSASRGRRFSVHELLRQFGEERLQKSGEVEALRDAHSQYYLCEVAQQTDRLKGSEQLAAMDHIDADIENVRAAWLWAVERGHAADIDASLEALAIFFAAYRRNPDEFISLLKPACDQLVDRSALDLRGSRLLTMLAQSLSFAAKPEANSKQDLERGVQVARQHNAILEEALALYGLGHYLIWFHPNVPEALDYYQDALHLFETAGEDYYTAIALGQVAYCQKALGRLPEAIEGYEKAVALRRKLGDRINTAVALAHIGECNLCLGRFNLSDNFDKEALREAEAVGHWFPLPAVEARLALKRFLRGEVEAGAQQAEAALRTALETSAQVIGIGRPYALAVMSVAKSVAGDYPAGRELAEQAVTIAANLTVLGQILSQWALSVALLGQGEDAAAREAATKARKQAEETNHLGLLSLPLPVMAALEARRGAHEEALDLLAEATGAGPQVAGWLEKWPLIEQLQKDL